MVEVGVRALVKRVSQAPGEPEAPQLAPVPEMSPFVSTFKHCVEPVMVLMVRAPATVAAPLRRVVPRTERVVLGTAVPIPTPFSLAFITPLEVFNTPPSVKVEVAEAAAEKAPPTLKVELMVDDAFTKMPAVVEVGVRARPAKVDSKGELPEPVPQAEPLPETMPSVSAWRHWVEPTMPETLKEPDVVRVATVMELLVMTVPLAEPTVSRLSKEPSRALRYLKSPVLPEP